MLLREDPFPPPHARLCPRAADPCRDRCSGVALPDDPDDTSRRRIHTSARCAFTSRSLSELAGTNLNFIGGGRALLFAPRDVVEYHRFILPPSRPPLLPPPPNVTLILHPSERAVADKRNRESRSKEFRDDLDSDFWNCVHRFTQRQCR